MKNNNYVLIDCELIHKYLVKKKNIKFIEEETLLTIAAIQDLSGYKVENRNDKLILKNESERLVFKKADKKVACFEYFLDEFPVLDEKDLFDHYYILMSEEYREEIQMPNAVSSVRVNFKNGSWIRIYQKINGDVEWY